MNVGVYVDDVFVPGLFTAETPSRKDQTNLSATLAPLRLCGEIPHPHSHPTSND
jgi:hypothetical protein